MTTITQDSMAVFWGCLIPIRLPWIEAAARKVLPLFGIRTVDLPFSCCPEPLASKALSLTGWLALAARNMALAEERGLDMLNLCSGCHSTFMTASSELEDMAVRERVNGWLSASGRTYRGTTRIHHIQQWLFERIGTDAIRRNVRHPLRIRVAAHTGCHYMRPADVLQTDHPVFPEQLDMICGALGMESPDFPDKHLCCGAGLGIIDREGQLSVIERKIVQMHRVGVQAIVAHCPSCIQAFENGQQMLKARTETGFQEIPVLHLLEAVGLAWGLPESEFAFDHHGVNTDTLLQQLR